MKIIKQGAVPTITLVCSRCGCVFEVTSSECKYNIGMLEVKCPEIGCGNKIVFAPWEVF